MHVTPSFRNVHNLSLNMLKVVTMAKKQSSVD